MAIASPDGVISIAVGLAERERDRAISPETTMLAASIGKAFVAATVLQLLDEGQLDLDEPISNWLGVPGRRPDLVIRFGKAPAMPMSMRRSMDSVLVPA